MRLPTRAPRPAAALLLAVLGGRACRAQLGFGAIEPGARSLTIEELERMVATETSKEFNFSGKGDASLETAEKVWADANAFEWKKADEAEWLSDQMYPYLLCHVGKDSDGKNLSGYQRTKALTAGLGLTTEEEIEEKRKHFRTLYNEEDFLCVYGQLLASEAAGITGEEFVVQPLVPSLKYMKGSVDGMRKEVDFTNTPENKALSKPSLDIVLCPGVSKAKDGAGEDETVVEGWEEVSQETAGQIIEMLVPSTKLSQLANAIADTYYLTSEAYVDAVGSSEGGEDATERSKLWRGLIRDYQESRKCDDVYRGQLDWKLKRARSDGDISLLNVEFNTTGNTDFDVGCMLTLSLAIAAHPDVCSLESRERVKVQSTIQWVVQSELEGRVPFFDSGLDGTGQVVAVSDTGIDVNNCYFKDPDGVNADARKIAQYIPFVDGSDYRYGHGTHVAGIVAGKRLDGKGMADGVAPGAKLAFIDIGNRDGALSLPLDRTTLDTGSPDAKIHSASWGSELNSYTTQARNFDQHMYDNDEFLILIAAGNSGKGDAPNTVGSPATGKNIIAVGAHQNPGLSAPKKSRGPGYVADFSSRGPTSDGRTKPDILGPGKAVLSAGALPGEVGECDPSKNPGAGGKSGGVFSTQGTSMATPAVSGTAAIVRQYFEQGYYPTGEKNEANILHPSGALIKAVLMNGAQFLKGVDNGADGVTNIQPYDNNQNFGRVALQHSLYLPGKTDVQITVWDRETVEDQGSGTFKVKIDKSNGCAYDRLSVTLVWVEQGSSPGCTSCVLNDLDLSVELNNQTYYPNGKESPDRLNNAERVIINGIEDGDEPTITVHAYNLAAKEQKYSVVATGCFGGVANQNFVDQCSVFECSASKTMQNILLGYFIPLVHLAWVVIF